MSSEFLELKAADGHVLGAYLARPDGPPRGALVVLQEIFGVNSHIRGVADGFAREGWLAIAPALFDRAQHGVELGYGDADRQRGMALKNAVGNEAPLRDIAAALDAVRGAGKAGLVGYCWGGLLAWLAAGSMDGLGAAVCYYGGGMQEQAALAPRCAVLAHFGEHDAHIPAERVRAFAAAQPGVELHFYPAGHGFNCEQRGSFDADSATLARRRTLDFLGRQLG